MIAFDRGELLEKHRFLESDNRIHQGISHGQITETNEQIAKKSRLGKAL